MFSRVSLSSDPFSYVSLVSDFTYRGSTACLQFVTIFYAGSRNTTESKSRSLSARSGWHCTAYDDPLFVVERVRLGNVVTYD